MNKKTIMIFLITMVVILVGISLYSTFAYDEEAAILDDSSADYNLIYSIKESTANRLDVMANEIKYIDIEISNTYVSTVKYAMYYKLLNMDKLPDNVSITLADTSLSMLQDKIKAGEKKVITLKIANNSKYNIELSLGAVVGFENGNINDLLRENEILIHG